MKARLLEIYKELGLKDSIIVVFLWILFIHIIAFGLIIFAATVKYLFFKAIEFWIFFYDFFANGLVFPESFK